MSLDRISAAVAAGVLPSEDAHRELLRSVAETSRAIFGAQAASIFLYDEATDELVFEAVAGSGEDQLIGRRFPSSRGIAGWVLVTRQPLVIEDVTADPRFAKDVAADTGYVPKGIMAVPLLHEERSLGVLEVLDRPANAAFSLDEMNLLSLFANQAAIALDLMQRSRRAGAAMSGADPAQAALAHIARRVEELGADAGASRRFLEALAEVLGPGGREDDAGERPMRRRRRPQSG
jgi:GAF domain-containing protein